jgi:BirA family biotin operon repressor/biotin-[acetyl-CoA-carboxylase] ligase
MEKEILRILNQNKGKYISGQVISEQLNVSRMSISTYIKKLKEKGYIIETSTKKGYCFDKNNDVIDIDIIKENINDFYKDIIYFDEIDSTNNYLKNNNFNEGTIVIADSQTSGRGRNGKSFFSPKQKGIYLSFVIKPHMSIYESLKITACIAVALRKVIEKNYQLESQIKWVNDIILNDKKISGILCEASLEMNTASIESMIVGIGMNVHSYTMPDELKNIAGCIEDYSDLFISREKIIIDVLNTFYDEYMKMDFLDDYRKYSYILHQNITVYENNQTYKAYVKDINDDASLTIIVDNQEKILNSGEISLKKD